MEVTLIRFDQEVLLNYTEEEHGIDYSFGNESFDFVEDVVSYLEEARSFRIPESGKIDDFREDFAEPVKNLTYFELALCELFSETEIWVKW